MRYFISFITVITLISCKNPSKEEKHISKKKIYFAKCGDEYSTGEKVAEKDKNWNLTQEEIISIINLSHEIDEQDIHFSYPITPCNIDIDNFILKNKTVNLHINGGSFLEITENKKTRILGCDDPKCIKYFIAPKEEMDDENQEEEKSMAINNISKFDKLNDSITIKHSSDTDFTLIIFRKKKLILNKSFICDKLLIDTKVKYGQLFNIKLEYQDQYRNTFRKITIPVLSKADKFYVEKIFIAQIGISAKTGNEEWLSKEISTSNELKNLDLDELFNHD